MTDNNKEWDDLTVSEQSDVMYQMEWDKMLRDVEEAEGCYHCGELLKGKFHTVLVFHGVCDANVNLCDKCFDEKLWNGPGEQK